MGFPPPCRRGRARLHCDVARAAMPSTRAADAFGAVTVIFGLWRICFPPVLVRTGHCGEQVRKFRTKVLANTAPKSGGHHFFGDLHPASTGVCLVNKLVLTKLLGTRRVGNP